VSRGPRYRRSRPLRDTTAQSWVHLVFFAVILLGLLLFRQVLGERAAGCFAHLTVPVDAPLPPADDSGARVEDGAHPVAP